MTRSGWAAKGLGRRIGGLIAWAALVPTAGAEVYRADVVVYGGTAGGVIAAVAAAREGKSVLLIEPGKHQLIPLHQPQTDTYQSARRKNSTPAGSHKVGKEQKVLTQHTGLPPRGSDGSKPWDKREQAKAAAEARNQQAARERAGAGKGKGKKPAKKPAVPR